MNIEIRECRIEDAAAIHELNCREMGYDYPLDKTQSKLARILTSSQDKVFAAVYQGEVIGYIHVNDYDLLYAPHMKNIMGIAVSSACRKMGAGRMLMEAAETWARENGAEGIRLVSGATRTGAHEFYRRLGYDGGKQQINFKKYFR
ncbi:GNAT family N-acetyltransferase [Clostridium sp. MCC353]|uniref:GNAT family N-acetyltransferase n=1 Tax=Clostridium sp. MCC353 TaxID=2592646 RepID=UPI001C02AE86|nr:GNAT family N-acetyltransferase [Clostridium sp. MCC353]MBT9777277.1 GNAT family N-acetyltransferase [Clostridium sp. MCC353]